MLEINTNEYLEKVVNGMEVIKDFYTAMDSIDKYKKPLYSEEDLTIIRMNHGGVNDLIIKYLKENGKDYKEGHDYVLECFDILTVIKQYQKDTFDRLSEKLKEDEGIGVLECLDSIGVDMHIKQNMEKVETSLLLLIAYNQLIKAGKKMSKFRCDYIYFGDYKMPVSEDEDAGLDSLIEAIHMYRNKEISSTELLASLACTQQIVKNTETIRNSRERIYKELVHNFVDLKQYIDVYRFEMAKDPELKEICSDIQKLSSSDILDIHQSTDNNSDKVSKLVLAEQEEQLNKIIKEYLSNYGAPFYISNPYFVIKKMIPLVNIWIMKKENLNDKDRHAIVVSRKLTELLSILAFTSPL